jgi:glycosyltransferase involved in cell wall biosynthesis
MPEVYDRDRTRDLDLTVLLPSFNEEEAIGPVIREIRESLKDWPGTWEILVVDDASSDQTAPRAVSENVRVLRRPENGGSGASRKTGTRAARGRVVAMLDADGTYIAGDLPQLLSYFPDYDQVNGARTSEKGTLKALRFSAKLVIRKLAEFISGKRIPDLNTGLKLYKRDLMLQYLWCMPDGFSCVTSMTLAFLCNGHPVKYVDVGYRKRIGVSKFHPVKDAAKYFATMLRIIMYFRPLRVFWPLSVIMFSAGVAGTIYHSIRQGHVRFSDSEVMFYLGSVLVLVIGLLADLIVAQRRHLPTELFRADELRENIPTQTIGASESVPAEMPENVYRAGYKRPAETAAGQAVG